MLTFRILAVSDAHDLAGFKNTIAAADKVGPDLILSCGDWGSITPNEKHPTELELMSKIAYGEQFLPILNKAPMFTLYGNHDYIDVLKILRNESYNNSKCLIPDIEPIYFEGVKIVGINGNYAIKKRQPWHKTFYELETFSYLLDFSEKVRDSMKDIDIFMTHEQSTLLPAQRRYGQPILTEIIRKIKPKIHLCGHIHRPEYFFDGTTHHLNLGMSLHGDYAVIDTALMDSDSFNRCVELLSLDVQERSDVTIRRA